MQSVVSPAAGDMLAPHVHIRPNETTHLLTTSPRTYMHMQPLNTHTPTVRSCNLSSTLYIATFDEIPNIFFLKISTPVQWDYICRLHLYGSTFVDSLQCHDWLQAAYLAPHSNIGHTPQPFTVTLLLPIEGQCMKTTLVSPEHMWTIISGVTKSLITIDWVPDTYFA